MIKKNGLLSLLACGLALFMYRLGDQKVLNFPLYLLWFVSPIAIIVSFFLARDKGAYLWVYFWNKPSLSSFLQSFFITSVFSVFLSFGFMMPVDYYIIYYADKETFVERVPIKKVSFKSSSKFVYFSFRGDLELLRGHDPIMLTLSQDPKLYKDYVVCLYLHNAPFGAAVIEKWNIEHK